MEKDLRQLIEEKLKLFPNIKNQIVNAKIEMVDGKEIITIASLDNPQNK